MKINWENKEPRLFGFVQKWKTILEKYDEREKGVGRREEGEEQEQEGGERKEGEEKE